MNIYKFNLLSILPTAVVLYGRANYDTKSRSVVSGMGLQKNRNSYFRQIIEHETYFRLLNPINFQILLLDAHFARDSELWCPHKMCK